MSAPGLFNVAVAVVIEKDEKILITKRSSKREHAPGEWEAGVTGRVNQGETCEQAANREVQEEIGIDVKMVAPFSTFHFFRGIEKAEHLGVNYYAKFQGGEIKLDHTEQVEYKWVTPQEALSYVVDPNVVTEIKQFVEFKKHYSL